MIEIREYTKREFARLYRPNTPTDKAAVELLRCDMHRCKGLMEKLRMMRNFRPRAHAFTPAQVKLILDYLCEP